MKVIKFLVKGRNAFWGMGILLMVVFAVACSQEEVGPQLPAIEVKKAEIRKLTEKYGLNFDLLEGLSEEEITELDMKEAEAFLQAIKNLISRPHPMKLVKEGVMETISPVNNKRMKTRSEANSWEGSDYDYYYNYEVTIGVTVSWYKNPGSQIYHATVSSSLQDGYGGVEYEEVYADASFAWEDTIFYSFKGNLTTKFGSRSIYGTGQVSIKDKTGYLSISIDA